MMQEVETMTTGYPKKGKKRAKEQNEDVGEDMGITASGEPVKKKRGRQKMSENPVKTAVE